jgi:two-component system CheB/CheR fusion protein
VTYAPEYDDCGEVVGWVASVRDITERKAAELALRESEERFRNMADAAPVLIWVSGTDKLCNWFNKPWLDFVGRKMEQEIGNGWAENVHADDLNRCLEIYVGAFEARLPFAMEYRLKRHDGEYRWILDNGIPRHGSEGEFVGYIGSCIDITDQKRTEDALRAADRRKDEFLATLAHELRNPLAPVRNAVEILRQKGLEIPELIQARDIIDRQLRQVTRLIDDLMDVSRITRDRLELRKERLDLAVVLRFAVEACLEPIDRSGQQIALELPLEPQYVEGDLTRLVQVFSNLLSNATKFSPPGGAIALVARRRGPEIVVTVRDEGIGIAAEMVPRIFEPFVQADVSLERVQGGLGIGLTLVKRVLEMHGGTIEAESEGADKGSTFTVRLPVSVQKPESAASPNDQIPPQAVRAGDRVLIADDNKDAAESLRLILNTLGYETRVVHDGTEALKAAEEFRPAFALLDLGMPRTNGYEVARHIRSQPWGKDLVLLAVTGWGQAEVRQKTREAGFDDHLVKPVDPFVLAERLASAAQRADRDRS